MKTTLKWKENQLYGKTYLPMIPQTRVWSPKYIKNLHDSTQGRQIIQFKNGQRTWTDTSPWRTHRGPRDVKGCLASLAIRKMQIKTTMRYHFTPVRMAIINKSRNNKCWRSCAEKGTLVHCWWDCRLMQPLWKTVWNFFRKLKMELPFDLAIPLLGLYPKNLETPIQKNPSTQMFIAANLQ